MSRFKSVTVGELARALAEAAAEFGEDTVVAFSSDYGDYGHTQQVHRISGDVALTTIEPNAYSVSGFALREREDEPGDEPQYVLVID